MKTITILGSTGSIGTQALEVANKHNIRIKALAAHSNVDLLASQAIENNAEYDIGDIVGARENITGVKVTRDIVKKIVKVNNNGISVECQIGE